MKARVVSVSDALSLSRLWNAISFTVAEESEDVLLAERVANRVMKVLSREGFVITRQVSTLIRQPNKGSTDVRGARRSLGSRSRG
jgi:hypothetical protein